MDYKKLANKKFEDSVALFTRHQGDADLINMANKFTKLTDANNAEIPNSVRVVLNDIATFTWRTETMLNSAVEQVEVTSDSKRFDTAYVEGFVRAGFRGADDLLSLKDMFPFNPFIDQQAFRRGSVASFCNFHFENKELIANITPWDTMNFVNENDNKGIIYTATKFTRSYSRIISDYPEAEGRVEKDKDTELLYIVARDTSQLWSGNDLIKELKNKLGYVPVVFYKVPMGSMLLDKDTIQYQGESGIFLIRFLFKELERIASIIQSLNLKVVDQALQIEEPNPDPSKPQKTVDDVTAPGAISETPPNTRYELMPLGQLQQQAQLLHDMITNRMQQATSSKFQNILQPKTATEIMMDVQEQNNIIFPRIGTRGLLKQDLAKMFIKQTIDACKKARVQTVKLGEQEFEISKLTGDYEIEFKYHFRDPRMDAARQSLATAQRGLIPDKDISINTLQREDWEGDQRQLRWEEDERISPLVKLDRNIRALLEDAKRGEPGAGRQAKMLIIQMIPALKQAMEGLLTPNRPKELEPARPLVPLLKQGNQGGQSV